MDREIRQRTRSESVVSDVNRSRGKSTSTIASADGANRRAIRLETHMGGPSNCTNWVESSSNVPTEPTVVQAPARKSRASLPPRNAAPVEAIRREFQLFYEHLSSPLPNYDDFRSASRPLSRLRSLHQPLAQLRKFSREAFISLTRQPRRVNLRLQQNRRRHVGAAFRTILLVHSGKLHQTRMLTAHAALRRCQIRSFWPA